MCDLLSSVRTYVDRHALLPSGTTVLVSVSGGPDSSALLDILVRLAPDLDLALHVAHLDHALRPDSASDADYVRALAARHELPFRTDRVEVAAFAREAGLSLEHAARKARRRFLRRTAGDVSADRIALGHTRSDQAETVLFRLLRGAGTTGLAGMRPLADNLWVRPLLDVSREKIETYLRHRGIEGLADDTNRDLRFTRNRIRHGLLPLLRKDFNPSVEDALARAAALLDADDDCLHRQAVDALKSVTCARSERKLALDGSALFGYHVAIRSRVLRRALMDLGGSDGSIEFGAVSRLLDRLSSEGTVGIAPDLSACRKGRFVIFGRTADRFTQPVAVSGRQTIPGGTFRFRDLPRADLPADLAGSGPFTAYLDQRSLADTLVVRSWEPGDRFRPLGMAGSMKLQDLLVNRGIPRMLRDEVPVVESGGRILWVVGLRTGHDARVKQDTRRALQIEYHGGWRDLAESIGVSARPTSGG